MATHSRILAWRIPWTEEPGGLQSMVSQRVRHNKATNTSQIQQAFSEHVFMQKLQESPSKQSTV